MEEDIPPPGQFALVATLFEASLAVVAVALGWVVGLRPAATFEPSLADLGWGLLATGPALGLFWFCLWCPWPPMVRLSRLVNERLLPAFRQCRMAELAVLSLVAGIGEEMLFRGLLQGGLAEWIGGPAGVWIGLAAGSLIFGLAHPISPLYALLTTLIGLYLGWLWIATGNLLTPIATHAAYDFLAMVYLLKIQSPGSDCSDLPDHAGHEGGERNSDS